MAVSTNAFFLQNPTNLGGVNNVPAQLGMYPESPPAILWGQGTPTNIAPFTSVNKGSLYLCVNNADDVPSVYVKVDEGGDADDWVMGGSPFLVTSALFDISGADSEQVVMHAVSELIIVQAGLIWNEATAASGAAEGDITIGVATGGAQIVAADAYDVSQASGAYQALTIVDGEVAAGESVFASHDQAAGANGTYFLQLKVFAR